MRQLVIRKRKSLAGFTLIEILLAILIFVIISGSLYFTLGVGLESFERGTKNFEIFQELRFCLKELQQDLRSLFYDSAVEWETFQGSESFFSCICYKTGGLYKISYYQAADGFFKSVDKFIFPQSAEKKSVEFQEVNIYHFADLVKKVNFEYLDYDYNWQNAWDISGQYPKAIKVTFYFMDNQGTKYEFKNVISIPVGRKIFLAAK